MPLTATLTWDHDGLLLGNWRVERRVAGVGVYGNVSGNLPASARSYTDNGVSHGTAYDWRVIALNQYGESPPVELVNVMVAYPPPNPPTNVQVVVNAS